MRFKLRTVPVSLAVLALTSQGCVVFVPLFEDDPFSTEAQVPTAPLPNSQYRAPATISRYVRPNKVERLLRTLKSGDAAARTNAATTLGYINPAEPRAVDALIEALRDDSKNVRRASVKALGRLRATKAIPHLVAALHDRDKFVAHSAAGALRKFNSPEARKALQSAGIS